ncbi:hypothetical protein BGZ94_001309 [Podila epigama]|nr:hypothetical protein BGZ94_001309 [Podila epigama]
MPGRRIYWVVALLFITALFLSKGGRQDSYINNYNNSNKTPRVSSTSTGTTTTAASAAAPNSSGRYDTLIVIPSSWTQLENRRWVRETVFGIRNNLEPCKKYDGRIIYKFYIHGHSTWEKSGIHTAQFMQAQVRNLYAEFMEFGDHVFTNETVSERHTIWGKALDWAVNQFVPEENIRVDKVLIFDSTTLVNLPKLEDTVRTATGGASREFLYTWGETDVTTKTNNKPFAAMISFAAAKSILAAQTQINTEYASSNLVEGALFYFNRVTPDFHIIKGDAQLWSSEIDSIPSTTAVVGQIYQQEDWRPLAEKMNILPTAPCAYDRARKSNIAVLTSSYVYVDMCMAEASLPSAENKRLYAAKHGYDFVARSAEFAQEEFRGRRLVWGKIGAIQKVLPHYEWLLWMDMDAIVADMDKDVREIIRMAKEASQRPDISLIVARPVKDKMLNAGVMLIRNTEWSRRFLKEVQRRRSWYHRKPSFEQGAIWEVIQEDEWKDGVHLFDRDDHTMNTFPRYYEDGDFIIHFAPAGCPAVPVLEALRKIKEGQSPRGIGAE